MKAVTTMPGSAQMDALGRNKELQDSMVEAAKLGAPWSVIARMAGIQPNTWHQYMRNPPKGWENFMNEFLARCEQERSVFWVGQLKKYSEMLEMRQDPKSMLEWLTRAGREGFSSSDRQHTSVHVDVQANQLPSNSVDAVMSELFNEGGVIEPVEPPKLIEEENG